MTGGPSRPQLLQLFHRIPLQAGDCPSLLPDREGAQASRFFLSFDESGSISCDEVSLGREKRFIRRARPPDSEVFLFFLTL
jgi:hypothetical protein